MTNEQICAFHHERSISYFEDGHDGPGWYWWYTEYPDEGSVGAYETEAQARAEALEDFKEDMQREMAE